MAAVSVSEKGVAEAFGALAKEGEERCMCCGEVVGCLASVSVFRAFRVVLAVPGKGRVRV